MKELSIEEKAKRYDEAIEQLRTMMPNWENLSYNGKTFLQDLVHIIPELREESEDERIRKALIKFHKSTIDVDGIKGEDVLAWLEKKGEQKPVDNIEPKFKVGDWITDGSITIQIEAIKNNCYLYCGDCYLYSIKNADKVYHLWTVQDAKDGDVLYNAEHNYILIYKHQIGTNDFLSYCRLCLNTYTFYPCEEFEWDDLIWNPSTKEQREQLEKAMTEDGYEWDTDKKELKKIGQKQDVSTQIDPSEYINDMGGNGCYLKNTVQSSTWSDEDFYMLGQAIKCVNNSGKLDVSTEEIEDWLKSFKDRIQPQPKQEWGEEDERIYKSIIYSFAHNYPLTVQQREFVKSLKNRVGCETNCTTTNEWSEEDEEMVEGINNCLDELEKEHGWYYVYVNNKDIKLSKVRKWLKERITWKPSDEEMKGIECAIKTLKYQLNTGDNRLDSLYSDLKKLRGE